MTSTLAKGHADKTVATPGRLGSLLRGEYAVLIAILLAMIVYFALTSPVFFSARNAQNLGASLAVLAILAAGQLFVIISGGIDISVAAQVGFLSILAIDMSQTMPVAAVVPTVIICGALIGLVNGVMIAWGRISPIITTVAMLQVLSGLSLVLTGGQPRRNFTPEYTALGTQSLAGIPLLAILAAVIMLFGAFLLNRTTLGRYAVAIGGNSEAAHLSGIKVKAYTAATYVLNSIFVAVAAVALSSRTGSGLPDLGAGIEITTIAAVFIGGVAWGGGRGSMVGALLGVLLIGVIGNGLDLNSINSNIQIIITGLLMAAAVGLGMLRDRGRRA
jgi:ribose/xylose/arabinose/galactoside ABC-type transport system permease subunit